MRIEASKSKSKKKPVPFAFVLELLAHAEPFTRPMFGSTAVYVGEKIVLILRDKETYREDNGVWVATLPDYHESLRVEFPHLRSIRLFGDGISGWQIIPVDAPDFESSVERACEMILENDRRIGKIPKSKFLKSAGRKPR